MESGQLCGWPGEEMIDKLAGWMIENFAWCAQLFELPLVHDPYAVRQSQSFEQVVGDENYGLL